jgi:beta-glucanase (GH16 family)
MIFAIYNENAKLEKYRRYFCNFPYFSGKNHFNMNLLKFIKTGIFLLAVISPAILNAQKYVQVWGDEFNTPGLPDSTKWDYEIGFVRNNELQYYTKKRLENARIEDSVLVIEARKESFQGANYTSASLISKGTGDWKYGKIEISAKVPMGKGTWPALWMMPTYSEYGGWPRSGEIDIMEYVGMDPHKLHHYVHFEGTTGHQSSGNSYTFAQPYNQFIKFTLIWTPEKLEWYANDVKYHEYNKPAGSDHRRWPFDKEFYLILNLAYGGSWGGQNGVDDSKLPARFLIDYVRVYQLQEGDGPFSLTVEPAEGGTVKIEPELEFYPEGTEVTLTATPDKGFSFKAWKHFSGANPVTFKVNKETVIIPQFYNELELVENSTFDVSYVPWAFYIFNAQTAAYQASVNNGVFTVDVTQSPGIDWQLGFQQLGFSMRKGTYTLKFDAWADQQKQLLITVSKNYPDWGEIIGRRLSIGTEPDSYELTLNMPRDDDNVRLYFGLGNFTGQFHIDNISMSRVPDEPVTSAGRVSDRQPAPYVFPNPAREAFSLRISENLQAEKPVAELFTIDGRRISETKLQQTETIFKVHDFKPGIYLLRIKTTGESFHKRVLVVE